jgi:hypothetical protein
MTETLGTTGEKLPRRRLRRRTYVAMSARHFGACWCRPEPKLLMRVEASGSTCVDYRVHRARPSSASKPILPRTKTGGQFRIAFEPPRHPILARSGRRAFSNDALLPHTVNRPATREPLREEEQASSNSTERGRPQAPTRARARGPPTPGASAAPRRGPSTKPRARRRRRPSSSPGPGPRRPTRQTVEFPPRKSASQGFESELRQEFG